jgi:hypothetical protein
VTPHRLYVISQVFEALLPFTLLTWVAKKAAGRLALRLHRWSA